MKKNLNEIVLEKIQHLIPKNLKPVTFFMDVLNLGKESAYRRLRGEKTLSFEEVHKLSLELNFSMDEITGNNKSDAIMFTHINTPGNTPDKNLLDFFRYYEMYLNRLNKTENAEIICTMNHLLITMLVGYDDLFKFIYYRWMHQMTEAPLNFLYSDLVIPAEIKELCNRIVVLHRGIRKLSFIIDNSLNLNLIKEMQYFYVRGLLNEAELNILKEQYLSYLDDTETTVKKGIDLHGTLFEIYLSVLTVNSTTSYAAWDTHEESAFWHHYGYPIFTRNRSITSKHRLWIDSLKKYSSLISQSNELLQADFFNRQRSFVNDMAQYII